jgi:hypothetical protein
VDHQLGKCLDNNLIKFSSFKDNFRLIINNNFMVLINKNSKMFFSGNLVPLIKELKIQKFSNLFLQICNNCNFRMLRTNCYLNPNKYRNKKYQAVRKLERKIPILL